ncbi:toprim domain-containing protein [Acidithiobacillus sp. IBUN Pt1247-S3]|uniref:toprim domain-containing protein n=1 Tax=Acidithiobacillus sp. IBUN Pt1247-S3 TaxID=3166642 RepID=UPI0034E4E9C4
MTDYIREVLGDMASCGIVPSDPSVIQFDTATMIRFRVAGDKPGTLNGFCRLFSDGLPAGAFGSWKTGSQHVWCAKKQADLTAADAAAIHARLEAVKREREAEQVRQHQQTSEVATERFRGLQEASPDHGYLARKRIPAFTARQEKGLLVLPIQDFDGQIHSLQTIAANGRKMLLKGGAKRGFHIPIRDSGDGRLLVCEGFATGASLALMFPEDGVIAAIDAGNMPPVAKAAREQFPEREIVLAGDNDPTGVRFANKAAWDIQGRLMIPSIPGADWNDIFVMEVANGSR